MSKIILKFILTVFIALVASQQLPAVHEATKKLFAKRAKKGFSPLEEFNSKLWHTSE